MVQPPYRTPTLVLVLLRTSLSIPLSPGDAWFLLNMQSFLVTRHTNTFTVPFKINHIFNSENQYFLQKLLFRLEKPQIRLYI